MTTRQLLLDRSKWLLGWMSLGELSFLAELASELKPHSALFEIGSYCGRSSRVLADNMSHGSILYCIDPWNYEVPMFDYFGNPIESLVVDDSTADQFCLNLEDHIKTGAVKPRKSTWKYYLPEARADFIFIDADHTYESVLHDIKKALRNLEPNGILCGHDYNNFDGVNQAVDECFQKTDFDVRESIWCIRKS